jgi:hypothetical protein
MSHLPIVRSRSGSREYGAPARSAARQICKAYPNPCGWGTQRLKFSLGRDYWTTAERFVWGVGGWGVPPPLPCKGWG